MVINRFQELLAWQKAHLLTLNLYRILNQSKEYTLKDQLLRASLSIMNNIAEGFERKSDKEFNYFLRVGKGSCAEVRSMLILASDLEILDEKDFRTNYELSVETTKLIIGLIKKLKT